VLCYRSSTGQEGGLPSIISSGNGGTSPYPSYERTMMGVKGVKTRDNEEALANAGLAAGRALLQGISEASKLPCCSHLLPLLAERMPSPEAWFIIIPVFVSICT